jgi:hypothetical protein
VDCGGDSDWTFLQIIVLEDFPETPGASRAGLPCGYLSPDDEEGQHRLLDCDSLQTPPLPDAASLRCSDAASGDQTTCANDAFQVKLTREWEEMRRSGVRYDSS